jgi:serine/threonine-protein kinase
MGSVWVASHIELETQVAIKTIFAPGLARHDDTLRRFKREARAAAQLRGPNIVRVFDFGMEGDIPYIAMELLEGEDVKERLDRTGALALSEAASVISQISLALDTAHRAGLVHRDVKPRNVYLAKEGEFEVVKLLDFGVAKDMTGALASDDTASGMVLGSPRYMSPEQARGERVDARSDIWSLGIVAFELLSGAPPFTAATLGAMIGQVLVNEIPSVTSRVPSLPSELDVVLFRALERNPAERYASAGEFAQALEAVAREYPNLPSAAPGPRVQNSVDAPPSAPLGRSSATIADVSGAQAAALQREAAAPSASGTIGPVDTSASATAPARGTWGARLGWIAAGSVAALVATWVVTRMGSDPRRVVEPTSEMAAQPAPAPSPAPSASAAAAVPPAAVTTPEAPKPEPAPKRVEPGERSAVAKGLPRIQAPPAQRKSDSSDQKAPKPAPASSSKVVLDSDFGIPVRAPQ